MAYNDKALRVEFGTGVQGASVDGAGFYRQATYITDDAPATVEAANYFNAAAKRLPKGTVIDAVMGFAGTIELKRYVVSANDGATVTIKLQKTAAG